MSRFKFVSMMSLALLGAVATLSAARAADKPAEQILKEIQAIELPKIDAATRANAAAMTKFRTAYMEAQTKKADLIGDLYKKDPTNAALTKLMPERWNALGMTGTIATAKNEIDEIAAHSENAALKTDASFYKAALAMRAGDTDNAVKATEAFIKVAPKDERGAQLLYAISDQLEDAKKQTAIYQRIAHDYPDTQAAQMVAGKLKRMESIGKPFELEFTDAVKGSEVSIKGLKGKVVVLDFWATWCGPCVAEMPTMKKLYAEYKSKGVEFIGVSLDAPKEEGGLDKLKKFVADNEIPWLQYYQGEGWQSKFSSSWGINSIPAVFVIDGEGKLYSVEARGKLDTMIPELLKKAKGGAGAGAGGQD